MPDPYFEIRQCKNCGLRYPLVAGQVEEVTCPACHSPTQQVTAPYPPARTHPTTAPYRNLLDSALLDNIRSTWNVGAMFRSADGAGLHHLYLGGYTATPKNSKVGKTALGAEKHLTWSHHPNSVELAQSLVAQGKHLIALEGGTRAESIFQLAQSLSSQPATLVVGNEVSGVDPGLLDLCEHVVYIPMTGIKESLNAAVAFGVAVYQLQF